MVFSSVTFLFFFLPIFLLAYFSAPNLSLRNGILLGSSLLFYAWGEFHYLPLLLTSIVFNYGMGIAIDRRQGRPRFALLTIAIVINLLALAVFKYGNFAIENAKPLFELIDLQVASPEIRLPLGISFFTFHAISYLVDVGVGKVRANHSLSQLALYITMFPQLVAGPIVRYAAVGSELRRRHHTWNRASVGTRIFVIGLAWKVLIADQLSPTASAVFDNNLEVGLIEAWIGLWAYTLQIYFDFGGYSNMAIGLGLILGFPFPRNFRTPYASLSVTEFWRRWHISLSSWFRDYMYIPMGGSRLSASRTYFNLLSVFFFCGLWHGASWTFVVWGLYHGFFLIAERAWLLRILDAAPHTFRMMYTLLVIMGGWVLFRATDLDSALVLYAGLAGMNGVTGLSIDTLQTLTPLALMVFMVGLYLSIAGDHAKLRLKSKRLEATVDAVLIGSLTLLCSISVGADTFSPFLYFRF